MEKTKLLFGAMNRLPRLMWDTLIAVLVFSLAACAHTNYQKDDGDGPRDKPPPVIFGEEIDTIEFNKYIVAIAFDIFNQRSVIKPGAAPPAAELGEPSQGVGRLLPPMGDAKDRPLPWVLTPTGKKVLAGRIVLPPDCQKLVAHVPQPAHGRWRNPRDIILNVAPGIYSFFVDDLDCSSGKVDIRKEVELRVVAGPCTFVGQQPNWTREEVVFTEPKGWSIQPAPVVFGGRLIVPNLPNHCTLSLRIIKKAEKWPEEHVMGNNFETIKVVINP